MQNLISNTNIKPGIIGLVVLMGATRFHHFGSAFSLPDASIAVFFLAGLWFGGILLFVTLLVEAGLIDYIAITQFSVSDFCISPAYVFLIPAYAAVWFGGVYSAKIASLSPKHLAGQFMALLLTISLAFVISNGSFYLLSDKYIDINWAEYVSRFIQYYPSYLSYAVFYVLLICGLKLLCNQITIFQSESRRTIDKNQL